MFISGLKVSAKLNKKVRILAVSGNLFIMIKYSFLFFIAFLIGLLSVFSGKVTTSVVPGWHTTIYPPWFFVSVFQILWLGVASAIYFLMEKRGNVVNRKVFLLHIFLSLLVFLDNSYAFFDDYYVERFLVLVPFTLFLLGQIIFIIGVLKAKKPTTLE